MVHLGCRGTLSTRFCVSLFTSSNIRVCVRVRTCCLIAFSQAVHPSTIQNSLITTTTNTNNKLHNTNNNNKLHNTLVWRENSTCALWLQEKVKTPIHHQHNPTPPLVRFIQGGIQGGIFHLLPSDRVQSEQQVVLPPTITPAATTLTTSPNITISSEINPIDSKQKVMRMLLQEGQPFQWCNEYPLSIESMARVVLVVAVAVPA